MKKILTHTEFFERSTRLLLKNFNLPQCLELLREYLAETVSVKNIRLLAYPIRSNGDIKVLIIRSEQEESSTFLGNVQNHQKRLIQALESCKVKGELIVDQTHPVAQWYAEMVDSERKVPTLPWYVLGLWDEDRFLGECRFTCSKEDIFTPEECELIETLRPVLCIALNNYQQYLELQEARTELLRENKRLKQAISSDEAPELRGILGGLRHVAERINMIAAHDVSVLITGETGTGKELVARRIHNLSYRCSSPFIALNCGAIPSTLIDSELFGHVKGAFTGALQNHKGYFERAHGGTLFLDEVGELPADAQVRLLRVLQEGEIVPVGSTTPVKINTRIIAATNRNLYDMMRNGTFREDLFYRLRVAHIFLPPLRQRKEDLPDLVYYILKSLARKYELPVPELAEGEWEKLRRYDWPGNVRELQNVLLEALISTPHGMPLKVNFFQSGRRGQEEQADAFVPGGESAVMMPVAGGSFRAGVPVVEEEGCLNSDAMMAAYYKKVLDMCHGRIKGEFGAAAKLGVHPSTLRFRLKKLGILEPRNRKK